MRPIDSKSATVLDDYAVQSLSYKRPESSFASSCDNITLTVEIPQEQLQIASNFRNSVQTSSSKIVDCKKEKVSKDFPKIGDTINVGKNSFKVVNSDYLRKRIVLVCV